MRGRLFSEEELAGGEAHRARKAANEPANRERMKKGQFERKGEEAKRPKVKRQSLFTEGQLLMTQKKQAGSPKGGVFELEVGTGGKAKLVCINLAHVSEIVWDAHDENPTLAKLVMASGETYDLTDEEAAAITRRLENPR